MQSVWFQLFRADAKRIFRDPFMLLVTTYLPLIAVAFRWLIPMLADTVEKQVHLPTYYPLIVGIFSLILPHVFGLVLGLQLLGEKDENSLAAIAVTPFSFRRYFFFRATLFGFVSVVLLLFSHEALGLVSVPLWKLCLIALVFSLNAPLSALLLASLAKNQVEGFAVMKGSGVIFMGPLCSFFLPEYWDLLLGFIPHYWPIKGYFLAVNGGSLAFFFATIVLGVVTQLLVLHFMYKRFVQNIH